MSMHDQWQIAEMQSRIDERDAELRVLRAQLKAVKAVLDTEQQTPMAPDGTKHVWAEDLRQALKGDTTGDK